LRAHLWRWLCARKGIPEDAATATETTQSAAFDRLADLMEQHLDLDILT
jgi:hypothetical protein